MKAISTIIVTVIVHLAVATVVLAADSPPGPVVGVTSTNIHPVTPVVTR